MSHSDAEMLRSDPLKNFAQNASIPHAASSSTHSSTGPSTAPAPGATAWSVPNEGREVPGKNGKIERRMFEWDEVFRNGEEWSFEEIRARRSGLLGSVGKEVRDWEKQWHAPGGMSAMLILQVSVITLTRAGLQLLHQSQCKREVRHRRPSIRKLQWRMFMSCSTRR
jgi:hypothetical protein